MKIENSKSSVKKFTWAYVVPNMYDFYIYKRIQTKQNKTKQQKSFYSLNNLEKNLSQSPLKIF